MLNSLSYVRLFPNRKARHKRQTLLIRIMAIYYIILYIINNARMPFHNQLHTRGWINEAEWPTAKSLIEDALE